MVRTELIDHITDPAGRAQADAYYGSMPILEADDEAISLTPAPLARLRQPIGYRDVLWG